MLSLVSDLLLVTSMGLGVPGALMVLLGPSLVLSWVARLSYQVACRSRVVGHRGRAVGRLHVVVES